MLFRRVRLPVYARVPARNPETSGRSPVPPGSSDRAGHHTPILCASVSTDIPPSGVPFLQKNYHPQFLFSLLSLPSLASPEGAVGTPPPAQASAYILRHQWNPHAPEEPAPVASPVCSTPCGINGILT